VRQSSRRYEASSDARLVPSYSEPLGIPASRGPLTRTDSLPSGPLHRPQPLGRQPLVHIHRDLSPILAEYCTSADERYDWHRHSRTKPCVGAPTHSRCESRRASPPRPGRDRLDASQLRVPLRGSAAQHRALRRAGQRDPGRGCHSTVKHYLLNCNETNRHWLDAIIDPYAHRESDLLAFEIAIERWRPGSVMTG
jgi:hypothetical protein